MNQPTFRCPERPERHAARKMRLSLGARAGTESAMSWTSSERGDVEVMINRQLRIKTSSFNRQVMTPTLRIEVVCMSRSPLLTFLQISGRVFSWTSSGKSFSSMFDHDFSS